MTTNYISVNSILYDLSLTIDDRYWNQNKMTEWAHKALRLIRSDVMLESKLIYLEVSNHKATLPSDLKYLTQIAYTPNSYTCCTGTHGELDLPPTSELLCNYVINNGFKIGVFIKWSIYVVPYITQPLRYFIDHTLLLIRNIHFILNIRNCSILNI